MSEKKYHCFWINAYGMESKYESFDALDPVLDLVKKSNDEYCDVRSLRVIWGELLEFEPCRVVETYRIKEID